MRRYNSTQRIKAVDNREATAKIAKENKKHEQAVFVPYPSPTPTDLTIFAGSVLAASMGVLQLRHGENIRDWLAGGFLLCWAYMEWYSFLISSGAIFSYPHFYYTANPVMFMWGPLLYLFVDALLNDHFEMNWRKWLHFLPSLLVLLSLLPLFFTYDSTAKVELIHATIDTRRNNLHEIIAEIGMYHIILYLLATFIIHLYPSRPARANYKVLFIAVVLMTSAMTMHLNAFRDPEAFGFMAASIASSILIFFIFISTFSNSKKFEDVSEILRKQRYQRSTRLQLVNQNEIAEKLQRIMVEQEPFLNSNLRITELARKLSLNGPQLSEFINCRFNSNFNSYINEFRVEKAKQLLIDKPQLDITNIAYDSGFNSISSFNAAFKKNTNITPGRYRKQRLEMSQDNNSEHT